MIGLCDCNNFFVSCQRLFQPDLNDKPVAVLSGNDGCIIARSNEVKELGIKMGVPLFQVKDIVKQNKVTLFSANHRLYSDVSQRVMATLKRFTPIIEIYSIDEAFIDFSQFDIKELKDYGETLAGRVKQHIGIPVSIGIAPTKTLAKIASKLCKTYPKLNGCCLMYRQEDIDKVLKTLPIGDVWGIGRRTAKKLQEMGVHSAYQFTLLTESQVNHKLHLPELRIWQELRGIPVFALNATAKPNQSIGVSRSFSHDISSFDELSSIIARFSSLIASKLRAQGSCVAKITTFLHTNRHRTDLPQHFESDVVHIPTPTDSTLEIATITSNSLSKIFKDGYGYKRAGITCSVLLPKSHAQGSLFDSKDSTKHSKLMHAIDTINTSYGRNSIQLATETGYVTDSNRQYLSPSYTTEWGDLPIVRVE